MGDNKYRNNKAMKQLMAALNEAKRGKRRTSRLLFTPILIAKLIVIFQIHDKMTE